jgi:hypothetical protein
MATRRGDTLIFPKPPVIAAHACIGGKKEGESPLAAEFDELHSDNRLGQASWEAAETQLQLQTARLCLKKAHATEKDVSLLLAGDLQAQCTASGYAARALGLPFAGLFGACSTMAEALGVGACLCSAGRNPQMTKAEITEKLCVMLGAEKVLWLPRGIYGDETNEHVDNVCAFTAPGKVVLAWTDNENDPQYALSKACADYLEQQTDAKGRKLEVTQLPIPQTPVCVTQEECDALDLWDGEPTRSVDERLAASYVNFYIANDSVLVPQFGDPMDKTACEILAAQFPTRKIIPIAAREILLGGGNIHCITQQIPEGRSNSHA